MFSFIYSAKSLWMASLSCGLASTLWLSGCKSQPHMRVEGIEPHVGDMRGDQPVKVLGANFRPDIGYVVYFGTQRATKVTIADSNTLTAITPSHAKHEHVDVVVRADNGVAFRIRNAYEYKDLSGNVMQHYKGLKQ